MWPPKSDYKTGMRFLFAGLLLLGSTAHARLDASLEPLLLAGLSQSYNLGRPEMPKVVAVQKKTTGNRERWVVKLSDEIGAPFRLVIDGPRDFGLRPNPVLFVSAGFFAGTQPIDLMQDDSNFVIAAFEYSSEPEALLTQPERLANVLKQVPARLFFSVRWLQKQSWVQHDQVHILGISLGSLYMPVALRLLQSYKIPFASFISGFGGAEVRLPFFHVLQDYFDDEKAGLAAELVETITAPFDPAIYLPRLTGPKLILHASRDELFTPDVSARLDETLTGPRLTCILNAKHIDMDRPQEIRMTFGILRSWLLSMTAGRGYPSIQMPGVRCY